MSELEKGDFVNLAKVFVSEENKGLFPGPEVIKRFSCSTQLNMKFIKFKDHNRNKRNQFLFFVLSLVLIGKP